MMKLNKKGFTLVELIVVIVIIGILAAIAAPSMTANVTRAKRAEAISAMGSIRTAYRLYTADKSALPTNMSHLNDSGYLVVAELNGPNYAASNYSFSAVQINAVGATAALNVNMNLITGKTDNP